MSRAANPSTSKGAIPKTTVGKGKPSKGKSKKEKEKEVIEWQLPSFSVAPKKKQEINWEKLKKDMARRQSPQGEDIKEIRRVLKEIKDVDVPVHEFIAMISQYTADNGTLLRTVMAEDLESFRKLAKKVYETMTQDISDVLINEQLQMVQYYDEKTNSLTDKMMRAVNEIYELAPKFDFQKYLKDKDAYLAILFPMPKLAESMGDEALEMLKRQHAFHRLQWLRSEGDRMAEENRRLLRRLEDLKREQMLEQTRAAEMAAEAEAKRQELVLEETEMQEKLDQLNESIEKSFVRDEMKITKSHNVTAMEPPQAGPSAATGAVRKTSRTGMKKPKKRPEWATTHAADIEDTAFQEKMAVDTSKRPPTRPFKKSKPRPPPCPAMSPPFHYSPPKTPPDVFTSTGVEEQAFATFGKARAQRAPKQTSPFHYSPPKSPPMPQTQETHIEESSHTVQMQRPQPRIRQTRAPRDTWGGFG